MKNFTNKILSILIALCIISTCAPNVTYAKEAPTDDYITQIATELGIDPNKILDYGMTYNAQKADSNVRSPRRPCFKIYL